ncbi:hypothetical protein BDN71DRAFT_1388136 [Pleurotus eryngii]|uniref:ZW10 C-terminal helical domain-containing protein n=1 Tax=Pleurotus eryngii TaxID=5323 RepID=A0A9P6DI00_PLEER|nr:hypothetical protein BDN71DRAFT_1388136 [Pleurotus eryngii]
MAFPIPAHLPRKPAQRDVATEIVTKVDRAKVSSLTPALAASWVSELDAAIQSTQKRIHERIHEDLPTVEKHLASSKSIQARLESLRSNVDALGRTTGLLPTLIQTLTSHSELAKEFANASTSLLALSHLLQLKKRFTLLEGLVKSGDLCEAAHTCGILEYDLEQAPDALQRSIIHGQLKSNFRVLKDRTREQLAEAYSRSITVSAEEMTISSSVQVRQSTTILRLSSILSSIDSASLSSLLDTLRRDLTNHFIRIVLSQPTSVTSSSTSDFSGNSQHKITLFPTPPSTSSPSQRLESLSALLEFLSAHVFLALPEERKAPFTKSLSKAMTSSVLNDLLVPNLPTSFSPLSSYLELVQRCIDFEERLLEPDVSERPIRLWSNGLRGHYERQRRSILLDLARNMITSQVDVNDIYKVETDAPLNSGPTNVVLVQDVASPLPESTDNLGDDGASWGLDENVENNDNGIDESGWGLDDEPTADLSADIEPGASPSSSIDKSRLKDPEPDPADAWGWNDDDDGSPPTDDSVWDDPWADDSASASEPKLSEPIPASPPVLKVPHSTPSTSSPKVATRIEKFSKQKLKHASHLASPAVSSPLVSSPLGIISDYSSSSTLPGSPPLKSAMPNKSPDPSSLSDKRPPTLVTVAPKEIYTVTQRMRNMLSMVEDILREGHEFISASTHMPLISSSSSTSSLLLQVASETLDLFRALYPIVFQQDLETHPSRAMQFSNDCSYLGQEVEKLAILDDSVNESLKKTRDCLKVLSDSWYGDTIAKHCQVVEDTLVSGADGFVQTTDQDRYDECEGALMQVVSLIRRLAAGWKSVLSKSKYYSAIGQLVDAALSQVLKDILALPDITEVESHRLSELCRIPNSLEGLFVEDQAEHPFTAAYVPSWLKFSYLSELLEASMADITYLFEEGALVDFEIEELVRLVRALFADTPLRSATITKILAGHPDISTH